MAYKNKTYVAFDGDKDILYYNLMKAWKQNDNTNFNFYDAHDINTARDTSTEETIKRRLKERMLNSKVFVLLIGESTLLAKVPGPTRILSNVEFGMHSQLIFRDSH